MKQKKNENEEKKSCEQAVDFINIVCIYNILGESF